MSELMDLVDRVSKAESERDQLKLDLEQAKRTLASQMEQLASHNPALLERYRTATDEARGILTTLYPQLDPASEVHARASRWLEANGQG